MVMPFNFTHNYDFIPWLNFPGEEPLNVIYETKLLGLTIRSDLTFSSHVDEITKKVTKNMWLLLKIQGHGCQQRSAYYAVSAKGEEHLGICISCCITFILHIFHVRLSIIKKNLITYFSFLLIHALNAILVIQVSFGQSKLHA